MSSQKAIYSRVIRRETHSPRSGLAITLAVLLLIVCAWAITETIIAMLGRPALLVAPVDAARSVADLGRYPSGSLLAGGIVVALIGVALVILGLSSGRRARHVLPSERSAIVVDNEVIASALARQASYAGNVAPDNVSVSVSHRAATVHLRASSGQSIDTAAVKSAVSEQLDSYNMTPRLRARVNVTKEATVGA